MTQIQKAAAIIVLACLFVMLNALSGQSQPSTGQPPPKSTGTHQTDKVASNDHKESPEEAIARYNLGLLVFTAILAIATIALGVVTGFQLRLARAEFISTDRPRIILREVQLVADTIHYTVVNTGDTQATIVESIIKAEFVENQTRISPLRPSDQNDLGKIIIAGGELKVLTYQLPTEISFAIKFPMTRRIAIEDRPPMFGDRFFTGIIVYADDLGIKRRSVFRRRWDDRSLTFIRLTPEEERDYEYAD